MSKSRSDSSTSNTNYGFVDELCLWQMDFLTMLGKRIMPKGIWHGSHPEYASANGGNGTIGTNSTSDIDEGSGNKRLFLTFDDGPHPDTTPYLLELLEKSGATATFFLMGAQTKRHPQLVEEIVKAGHCIGNHTYNHHFMPLLSVHKMEKEIEMTNDSIEFASGQKPILFRPPYGMVDHRTVDLVHEREMTTVYWGAVPQDWQPIGAHRVVARVRKRIKNGALVVLHEGGRISEQSIEATRELLKHGTDAGFQFKGMV